jgi:hypothetical protein
MLSVIGQPKLKHNTDLLMIASMSRPACFKTACYGLRLVQRSDYSFIARVHRWKFAIANWKPLNLETKLSRNKPKIEMAWGSLIQIPGK